MADTDLIERELRERAEYRAKTGGPFTKENLVEWRAADELARLRTRLDAAPSPNLDPGVVEQNQPKIAVLPNGTGVCFGGRWNGWQFRKHSDGGWVSEMPLEMVDPMEGSPLASLSQPAKGEREGGASIVDENGNTGWVIS